MTSRKLLSLAAAALFLLPASSFAQVYVGFGGAAPTGDFKEVAKTGWMAILGADFDLGESGAAIYAEGFYGENKHEIEGDKTNPYGAMAGLLYNFSSNPDAVGVYVFGGGGLLVHKFTTDATPSPASSSSESQFGYQAGAGVGVPLGGALSLFGEGRFMGSKDTTYFGFLAGLGIDFSGGN